MGGGDADKRGLFGYGCKALSNLMMQ